MDRSTRPNGLAGSGSVGSIRWGLVVVVMVSAAGVVSGAPFLWDGGGGNDNWGTALNWNTDTVPDNDGTADLTFDGATRTTPVVNTPWSVASITFDDAFVASSFTVSGSDITLATATGIANNAAAAQTINANLIATAAGFNVTSSFGNVTLGGGIDLSAGGELTVAGAMDTTISGVISGAGGSLTKTGSGNLTLSGANTFTGTTRVSQGELIVNGGNAIADNAALVLEDIVGVFMRMGADETIGSVAGTGIVGGDIDLGGNTLTVGDANSTVYGGFIVGTGSLVKVGSGTLTLVGFNSFVGTTTVNQGGLTLSGGIAMADTTAVVLANTAGVLLTLDGSETIASLAGGGGLGGNVVLNASTLTVGDTNDTTFSGAISGSGSLVKTGSGTLTLDGANSFTGSTRVSGGGLTLNGGAAIADTAAVALDNTAGVLMTLGAGEQIGSLSGGGTAGGHVVLGANTLTVGDSSSTTYSGVISGTGSVTKTGSGTLILGGANTYTGTTRVMAGTLAASGGNAIADSGLVVLDNTAGAVLALSTPERIGALSGGGATGGNVSLGSNTLTLGDTSSTTFSGVISGTGGVTKLDTGTLTLDGANTFTGPIQVSGGTVALGGGAAIADDSAVVLDNTAGVQLTLSASERVGSLSGGGATGGNVVLGANTLTVGNSASTAYGGVVSGTGGLTKVGGGSLALTGANTYTGVSTVDAGTLVLNGSVAGDVLVNAAGSFGGSGTVGGDLTVAGQINAGNSAGTINITGNLTLAATATTLVEMESVVLTDQYAVTGTAALDGTVRFVPVNYLPSNGDQFTMLTAGGGVSGTFATITPTSGVQQYNLTYNPNDVRVTITILPFANFAVTDNQASVAGVLDAIVPTATGDWVTVLGALGAQSGVELQASFDQIVPEEIGALSNVSFASANVQTTNVSNRLSVVRAGGERLSTPNLQLASLGNDPQSDLLMMALAPDSTSRQRTPSHYEREAYAEQFPTQNWHFFASGRGTFGQVDETTSQSGYDFITGGLTVGADRKIGDRLIVGLMTGYANSSVDVDSDGGDVGVNSFRLGAYGSYHKGPFHVDAMIGGGYHDYDTDRNVRFGAIDRTASSSSDGLEFNVMAAVGYDFEIGSIKFGPTASLQYNRLTIDDYTESGAGALNLDVDRQTAESLLTTVGLRVTTLIDQPYQRRRIIPELRVAYQHESEDQGRSATARFASGGGGAFGFNTTDIGEDSALIGLGVTFLDDWNRTTFIEYDVEIGRSDYTVHSFRGGFRIPF